jgi:hypothetical protein
MPSPRATPARPAPRTTAARARRAATPDKTTTTHEADVGRRQRGFPLQAELGG